MVTSPRGVKIVTVYLAIVALSLLPVALGGGKLAGVYAVVTTIPWIAIFILASDAIDSSLLDRWYMGLTYVTASALLNCALLYLLVLAWERRVKTRKRVGGANDAA